MTTDRVCRNCSTVFAIETGVRGRPPELCPKCRRPSKPRTAIPAPATEAPKIEATETTPVA